MNIWKILCYIMLVLANSVQESLTENDEELEVAEIHHDSSSTPIYINFGVPGLDFPNFTRIPFGIRFSCQQRVPGFYADPQADCQVYHQCVPDGRSYSFLCGIGTIFNQRALTCDHWYNYDCKDAEIDYKSNLNLYNELGEEIPQEIDTENIE